jgi:oligoribonuclease
VILEIATIVTNSDLHILCHGPELVIHYPEVMLKGTEQWAYALHEKSGLHAAVRKSTLSLAQAEEQTLAFIKEYCDPKKGLLCGNSVWQDRAFLAKHMPRIIDYLHYRLMDVSTFKEMLNRWYPSDPEIKFKKRDQHRALLDIEESIAELQHYREYFFKKV